MTISLSDAIHARNQQENQFYSEDELIQKIVLTFHYVQSYNRKESTVS
jgi:hypothetical protein